MTDEGFWKYMKYMLIVFNCNDSYVRPAIAIVGVGMAFSATRHVLNGTRYTTCFDIVKRVLPHILDDISDGIH